MQNANWPLLDVAMSFQTGPTSAPFPPYWVSIKERTEGQLDFDRGKQYELDQYQTATSDVTVANTDGAFDPSNTGSPYYPMVIPYRGYRIRGQYPATINLLTAAQATAGAQPEDDLSVVPAGSLPRNVTAGIYPTGLLSVTYLTTMPASPTSGTVLMGVAGWSAAPGVAFTARCMVRTTASTASVKLRITWVDVNGATISATDGTPVTASTTDGPVYVTSTAPANVAGAAVQIVLNSSPGSSVIVQTYNWQVERNSTASSWVQPSRWFPIFSGLALSYPQDWDDAGTYGTAAISAVDIFGWLSQRKLFSPAYMELLAMGPSFLYCLDEPQGATQFYDATATRTPMAPVALSTGGGTAGAFTPGITLAASNLPRGIGGPVASSANFGTGGVTVLDLGHSGPAVGPSAAAAWSRIFAIQTPLGSPTAKGQGIWAASAPGVPSIGFNGYTLSIDGSFTGDLQFSISNFTTSMFETISLTNYVSAQDGLFHLAVVTMSADGKTLTAYLDGVVTGTPVTTATDMRVNCAGGAEYLGAQVYPNGQPQSGYTGNLALVSELPFAATAAQVSLLYSAFQYGGSGLGAASSASRYADILRWAQYRGPQSEDNFTTGQTVTYGPASELLASRDQSGMDVVAALQTVVDTEAGTHYVSGNGTVTLKSRRARYNQNTPAVTFGENTAGSEIPYISSPFAYDPTRIIDDAQVTQTSTGGVQRAIDTTAVATYGDIPLQRSVNSLNAYEVSDAAQFLVRKNKTPTQRIQTIRIPASSFTIAGAPNGAAWLALLGLEIGTRVRVNRRPPSPAAMITLDGFVEEIAGNFDDATNAYFDLQISSNANQAFGQIGSSHTTLHTAVTVGATSCVINPLPGSATNPIQADISSAGGLYEWVIDWGTASAEYVTVTKPTPNSAGYTTATLGIGICARLDTDTTNTGFLFAHAIGAVLQDIGGGV